jgi:hypothetical protein
LATKEGVAVSFQLATSGPPPPIAAVNTVLL